MKALGAEKSTAKRYSSIAFVVGLSLVSHEAAAWPWLDKYILDPLKKITADSCNNCWSPTAVAAVRGSETTVTTFPDLSSQWTVVSGELDLVDRVTGEFRTLHAGESAILAAPGTVLPSAYRWEQFSAKPDSGAMTWFFENLSSGPAFDVVARIVPQQPGIALSTNTIELGNVVKEAGPFVIGVNGWSPQGLGAISMTDPFLWEMEFNDVNGNHHVVSGIPSLHGYYQNVPEPSTLPLLGAGLLSIVYARRRGCAGARSR